ncbi:unnamed protein product, partial [Medioppia subpectinata]
MTYAQSVEFCAGLQALPFSTTLATIHTADEQSFLVHYLTGVFADGTNVWIGARRRRRRSPTGFQWTDGTDMEYSRWLADVLPAVPLVVKSPYLSIWLTGRQLRGDWTKFWTGATISMAGAVRVDSHTYAFMDVFTETLHSAVQSGLRVTPTQSVFTFTAGPIELVVNFFTPIDPTDLKRLSLPASYISMSARS